MMRIKLLLMLLVCSLFSRGQVNAERVIIIGRNALYYEDYVLSIQYFNQAISARPWHYEGYFFRGLAKYYLDDFRGGELDCSEALARNPFFVNGYQVRGLCRINQGKFDLAIEDYRAALAHEPHDQGTWQNLVLCLIEEEQYDSARVELDQVFTRFPKYARAHLLHGQILLAQQDTLGAIAAVDKVLEMDEYDADAWNFSAILSLQKEQYAQGEEKLTKAIALQSQQPTSYINRALARYHLDNWMGAMNDYNLAIDLDPNNYFGHFNRALLRAQVGEDNLAIEDFNFVLEREPDNMIALFNRALLQDRVGEYRAAVNDVTRVLEEYPDFMTGYQFRAQLYRKQGETNKAEWDEFQVLKAQLDRRTNTPKKEVAKRTRKKGDKEIEDYDKLVVADKEEVGKIYSNAYRGRVQDRKVAQTPKSMYTLNYYEPTVGVNRGVASEKLLDELNLMGGFTPRLRLVADDAQLEGSRIQKHFSAIDKETARIEQGEESALRYFARAMEYYMVQDFDNAIVDFSKSISLNSQFSMAYFMRAVVKHKQLELQRYLASESAKGDEPRATEPNLRLVRNALLADFDQLILQAPDFAYGYYNRARVHAEMGNTKLAVADYTRALELDSRIAEAYYNRGLIALKEGDHVEAANDLSKAGELGLYSAYSFLKQSTTKQTTQKDK